MFALSYHCRPLVVCYVAAPSQRPAKESDDKEMKKMDWYRPPLCTMDSVTIPRCVKEVKKMAGAMVGFHERFGVEKNEFYHTATVWAGMSGGLLLFWSRIMAAFNVPTGSRPARCVRFNATPLGFGCSRALFYHGSSFFCISTWNVHNGLRPPSTSWVL
jgi:hypothetical protein